MNQIECKQCGCVSSDAELFVIDPKMGWRHCPRCYEQRISGRGRWLWLLWLSGLIIVHVAYALFPQAEWLLSAALILWVGVSIFIAIIVHELGHYFAARFLGGRCPVVSFGEGRILWRWYSRNTVWQFHSSPTMGLAWAAFPASHQQRWRRFIMLAGGCAVNGLFCILFFSLFIADIPALESQAWDVFLVVNGIVNGLLGVFNLFPSDAANPRLPTDGDQILALFNLHGHVKENRFFEINLLQALLLRQQYNELIKHCEERGNIEGSWLYAYLLSSAYGGKGDFAKALHFAERAEALADGEAKQEGAVIYEEDGISTREEIETIMPLARFRALSNASIINYTFFLYLHDAKAGLDFTARRKEWMLRSEAALATLPWDLWVCTARALSLIYFADVREGTALLESALENNIDDDRRIEAAAWQVLAEGYRRQQRPEEAEQAQQRGRDLERNF